MRRAKLTPRTTPTGSIPTAVSYTVPRCFVCDEPIKSHRLSTSLLAGRTQYSHSPLPTKIGGYIGDEFVVVVTPQDSLCKHCMALINTMDRLELELRQHRYTLTQHLKTKYKLDGQTAKPVVKFEVCEDEEEPEDSEVIEVSDEEWTPKKKQRTESIKHHRCTICNASFTNLSLFMAHLSRHKQMEKSKQSNLTSLLVNNKNESLNQTFKCGCCSESFLNKESLGLHMQLHTSSQQKPPVSMVQPTPANTKPGGESESSVAETKPQVQASALFEDIEQLSQQDVLGSVGVCSEEQKGRVCLLALLNNGVCSDLSHRVPSESQENSSSSNSIAPCEPKLEKSANEQTISITVSVPRVDSDCQLVEQQLSLPTASNHANTVSVSYPVILTNPGEGSQLKLEDFDRESKLSSQNLVHNSSHLQVACLDLPDLSDSNFHNNVHSVSNINNATSEAALQIVNEKEASSNWNGDVINVASVPSGRLPQSLDMPSLLDEELLQENRNQENFTSLSNSCHLITPVSKEGLLSEANTSINMPSSNEDLAEASQEKVAVLVNCKKKSDSNLLSSLNKGRADSLKNIAIVSVTSVPKVKEIYDSDSLGNSWFGEGDNSCISEDIVPRENCNSIQSIPSDTSTVSQKIVIDCGKFADDQESISKVSSYV